MRGARIDSWEHLHPRAMAPFARHDLLVVGGDYPGRWHGETRPERLDLVHEAMAGWRSSNPRARILASVSASHVAEPLADGVRDDWWMLDHQRERILARRPDEHLVNATPRGVGVGLGRPCRVVGEPGTTSQITVSGFDGCVLAVE